MSDRPPSDGERAALSGFNTQYKIAADIFYSALLRGRLEWIRIADPKAGRVDDIQVATPGRIDAYQVKWGQTAGTFSFKDLTSDLKSKGKQFAPNLICQLADGWHRLSHANPNRRIYVHLISRDIPSPSPQAKIPVDNPPPNRPTFPSFLNDCWINRDWIQAGLEAAPQGWRLAMEQIRNASRLGTDDFLQFFLVCELHFAFTLPSSEIYPGREGERRELDITQLSNLLLQLAGSDQRPVKIDRPSLLNRLGWEWRFSPRFIHEFHVDELYQPIKSTLNELETGLSSFKRGYLALIGTPGSGKSTILTQCFRYRQASRTIRYYAFVPHHPAQGRGEASNFLHDIYVAIKNYGILEQEGSIAITREELLERISIQLAKLSEKWHDDKIMTYILVDGLDHIEREQNPDRSLLNDLPHPDSIPDGVLFILGTQKLDLEGISEAIKVQCNEQGRTINMQPLERGDVFTIINNLSLTNIITTEQKEIIFSLSAGHPLALSYLLNKLFGVKNENSVSEILNQTDPYHNHIDNNYEIYWRDIEKNAKLKDLFGLICRMRIPFNPIQFVSLIDETTVYDFVLNTRHYFREEKIDQWRFFHNSFRQFVLNKTRLNILGQQDPKKDCEFHERLARFAANAGYPFSWEEIYHLAGVMDWESVIKLGTQDYFREQFFTLRHISAIKDDVEIVLQAAQKSQDGVAIIRCLLIEQELFERHYVLDDTNFPELILDCIGPAMAVDYVLLEDILQTDQLKALSLCQRLVSIGERELSRNIFNAAEPLDLLMGIKKLKYADTINLDVLNAWARVAHNFRHLDEILDIIYHLESNSDTDDKLLEETNFIRDQLARSLIDGILISNDARKIQKILTLLDQKEINKELRIQFDFNICIQRTGQPEANEALERLIEWSRDRDLHNDDRVLLAELLYKANREQKSVAAWIEGISQPSTFSWRFGMGQNNDLSPFILRIRLNRLLAALGNPTDPVVAVPDGDDPANRGYVLFERHLVIIGNLWGQAWLGNITSPTEVLRILYSAFLLYERRWKDTDEWSGWFEIKSLAPEFYKFLIHAAMAHGKEAVQALGEAFEERWNNQSTRKFWPHSWRRNIALELYLCGDSRGALVRRLEILEAEVDVFEEIYERLKAFEDLSSAWIKLNEQEHANYLMRKCLKSSFGIYNDKDYQFSRWITWLVKTTAEHPNSTQEDIRRFAATLVVLRNSRRGSGTQDAAVELISLVAQWYPSYALSLCDWLQNKHALEYAEALEGLISGALHSPDPPIEVIITIVRYMLVPFQKVVAEGLIKELTQSSFSHRDPSYANQLLEELANDIEIKSYPSHRRQYWLSIIEGLRDYTDCRIRFEKRLEVYPEGEDSAERPTVVLKSGKRVTEEDAKRKVISYTDLIAFINKVEKVKYFHWDHILKPMINSFSREQVLHLREILLNKELDIVTSSLLASRLAELGYLNEAQSILEQLLEETTPSGWNPWYDGGSRLAVVRGLVASNPNHWRPKAITLLVIDYLTELRHPLNHLRQLDEYLPILFDKPPLDRLWQEIKEHVYKLYDFTEAEEIPPGPTKENMDDCHTNLLIRWLLLTIDIPIDELREAIHRTFCRLIMLGVCDVSIHKAIEELLKGPCLRPTQGCAILEAVFDVRPDFVQRFSNEISSLCASPNGVVRHMASQLTHQLGHHPQSPPIDRTEISAIYQLHLPPLPTTEVIFPVMALPPGESLPDTTDSLEMVRPFEYIAELLHRLTDIPMRNFLQRASQLMYQISPEETWNKNAQLELGDRLKAMGLQITYNRLRPQIALLAFSYIIAELADAGFLNKQKIELLISYLNRHDSALSKKDPRKRPEEITKSSVKVVDRRPNLKWIGCCSESLPSLVSSIGGNLFVLGELTTLRDFEWEQRSESRLSMICHPEWPIDLKLSAPRDFFPHEDWWYAEDYPSIVGTESFSSLVIHGEPRQLVLGSGPWLAFHPILAKQLGWQFDTTGGLFRWLDDSGVVMVETIWWQDGPMDRVPPQFRDICGEGWLVVSTAKAAVLLSKTFSPAVKINVIIRGFRDRGTQNIVQRSLAMKDSWVIG